MGKITYVGALGHGNVGDEALYQINRKVFRQYELVPSLRRQCSGITLLGGGTLIPVWAVLVLPNTYNYAFGVGVKNPSYEPEARPYRFHPVAIRQTKRFNFRFLGVRGHVSKRILAQWGIASEVVGDPCLLFEPTKYNGKEDTRIAVNIGWSKEGIWGGDERRVLEETVELCEMLAAEKYDPILIPFWVEDIPHIQEVSSRANIEIFEDWENTQKLLDFIASCHILVGEKLHALVFSAAAHTPFVSVEYRPKCMDFTDSVGFNKYNIRTSEMTSKRVRALIQDLTKNWDDMQALLRKNVSIYRQRLTRFAERITEDIESLPEDKWSPRYLSMPKWFAHKYLNLIKEKLQ